MKSTNNMMLTNLKSTTSFKLLFTIAIAVVLPMILFTAGCKGGETKPTTKPTAKPKLQADMSKPVEMYCIRNNTKIRDFNKTYTNWATDLKTERGFTNYAKIGKLSKYENITVYEILGNWAYIKTIGDVKGWTPAKHLKKWDVNKFFKTKDNIFSVKSTKELYNDAVLGKVYTKIEKGDTFRVLWGNGKRFFVVSKSGKSGWLSAESVDSSKLIVKNVDIENINDEEIPFSKLANKKFEFKDIYFIDDYGMLDGNISNVLLQTINSNRDEIIARYGEEVNITELLGEYYPVHNSLGAPPTKKIGNEIYNFYRFGRLNFLGMIGIIEIYRPKGVDDIMDKYRYTQEDYFLGIPYNIYMKEVNPVVEKNGWKNKIKISFYGRDANVKKIKEIELEGRYDFAQSISERALVGHDSVKTDGKGGLNVKVSTFDTIMGNHYISDLGEVRFLIDNIGKNTIQKREIDIHITKKELENAGWTANAVIREWENHLLRNTKYHQNDIKDKGYKYFYDKSIVVNGEKYYHEGNSKSLPTKYFYISSAIQIENSSIDMIICLYRDKRVNRRGYLIFFINSAKEIIYTRLIENVISLRILDFIDSGLVLQVTDMNFRKSVKIISGVNYEY